MPHLQALHQELPDLPILAISSEDEETLAQFCRQNNLTYHVLLDPDGDTFRAYRGKFIPYALVINKKGIVTNTFVGNYPEELRRSVRNQLSAKSQAASEVKGEPEKCEVLNLGAPPVKIGGRVFIPVRGILEWTGASVAWNSGTQTVTARAGAWCMALSASRNASAPEGCKLSDIPVLVIGGKAYLPVRDVGKALGLKLDYTITTKGVYLRLPSRCGFLPFSGK